MISFEDRNPVYHWIPRTLPTVATQWLNELRNHFNYNGLEDPSGFSGAVMCPDLLGFERILGGHSNWVFKVHVSFPLTTECLIIWVFSASSLHKRALLSLELNMTRLLMNHCGNWNQSGSICCLHIITQWNWAFTHLSVQLVSISTVYSHFLFYPLGILSCRNDNLGGLLGLDKSIDIICRVISDKRPVHHDGKHCPERARLPGLGSFPRRSLKQPILLSFFFLVDTQWWS